MTGEQSGQRLSYRLNEWKACEMGVLCCSVLRAAIHYKARGREAAASAVTVCSWQPHSKQ